MANTLQMLGPDLHIVSFAVPYPPTYGGAIDVFNRLKALYNEGLRIHLHCFVYGNFHPHNALKEVTQKVDYYPRISWPALLAPGTPYIVASRRNPKLLECLNEDNIPVLFEGIHTTGFMTDLKKRKQLLRSHNIEHQYYSNLARDSSRFHYLFFQRESLALERYECNHAGMFDKIFTISPKDQVWYEKQGGHADFVPIFHGEEIIRIKEGRGDYLLYHGDLSIESNQKAVLDLIQAPGIDKYPFVVAGKGGSRTFEETLTKYPNLKRKADVGEDEMLDLVRDAQIVIIHSRHSSGMKVKLFSALYNGRFIVANQNSVTNTSLDNALYVYNHQNELSGIIETLWNLELNDETLQDRKTALASIPDDESKAKAIVKNL